jgi:energy-coupling factor transporter transmembrane protein EcfT
MKKLSYWAKQNTWKARLIIIAVHLLLITLAWFTGKNFLDIGIELPGFMLYLFLFVYLVAVFTYPSVKRTTRKNYLSVYYKQKACDFLLAASTFGMILVLAGNKNLPAQLFQPLVGSTVSISTSENKTAAEILESLKYRDKSTLTRPEKRVLKQEFKNQLKIYAAAKLSGNKKASGEAGLIILAIIAALGLLYLVAALSCTLSCNGSDGAAIAVVLLGTAAIVLGLVFVIRGINKRSRRKIETQAPEK